MLEAIKRIFKQNAIIYEYESKDEHVISETVPLGEWFTNLYPKYLNSSNIN